jgi:hypothetical protein
MSVSATLGRGGDRLGRGARRRPPQRLAVEGDHPPAGGGRHQINGRAGGKSLLGSQPTAGPAGDRRVQRGGVGGLQAATQRRLARQPPLRVCAAPPRQSSPARPCAVAHSPIATYDVAPVTHAHAPIASTPVNSCRRPRRRRPSGTAANAAASDESPPHHRGRGRRRVSRSDGRAGQRAAPQAPGRLPRGQGKMPSRVRALAGQDEWVSTLILRRDRPCPPIRLRPRVGADHRHSTTLPTRVSRTVKGVRWIGR